MWVQIAIWVITTVIGMLLTPKPPKPIAPTPGNLDVPVAESGKAIPVLFGTRVIRQANVVWYGDVKTTEIRQSSGSGGKK
ncbi:hypothetical protein SKTS_30430 [Sulfurimicrobium lacus]|jgi:hypothetical protein|uniref:Uncharacterized protein n=1 Tax=Sulfurimicrobium lacus TaxID=2715678 RepID=A0A6F8VGC1_9PROT|nr:hypothetical protein [Sulfurimicrobium lacus]BCB28157.1 hypothetical protein SKTS_30430 [Sulfurimicrobium lacus]